MLKAVGKTDIGRRRKANQDAFVIEPLEDGAFLVVLCDGMGGEHGGNVASQKAVEIITRLVKKNYRGELSDISVKSVLQSAVAGANAVVYDIGKKDEALSGMGTTMEVALVAGRVYYCAHIGDSRIYKASSRGLEQLSRDHTVVQSLIDQGRISREQAATHPQRHLITRVLGVAGSVVPDYWQDELAAEEKLLLCSDGLTNHLSNQAILEAVTSLSPEDGVEKLIAEANRCGGSDNITVVVISD